MTINITVQKAGNKVITVRDLPPAGSTVDGIAVAFLNDLSDVVFSNLQDGDLVSYDAPTQKFINRQPITPTTIDGGTF